MAMKVRPNSGGLLGAAEDTLDSADTGVIPERLR
jgi:hypothetical protein